jgi:hypothetical protein
MFIQGSAGVVLLVKELHMSVGENYVAMFMWGSVKEL